MSFAATMNRAFQKMASAFATLAVVASPAWAEAQPSDVTAEIQSLKQRVAELEQQVSEPSPAPETGTGFALAQGKVILGGEGGVAFFESGSNGQFPDSEFRVDEARLFLDAEVQEDVYFFGELNLVQRESPDTDVSVGELRVDVEDVSRLWGVRHLVNLRAGRFDIPFGEEYQARDAIDNPLISHSVSDLWGIDEGVEAYGAYGAVDYVVAVQNGGDPSLHDYNSDKAVVARVGVEPVKWLRLSGSAMRTGDLDVEKDQVSAIWVGGGYLRAIGDPATTTTFHGELAEGDVEIKGSLGHLKAAAGAISYDDNDTAADNQRDIYYQFVEGVYLVTDKLYAATRWSRMTAEDGYPLVGNGDFGDYFYGPLTEELWRWSIGMGYRFSQRLVLKAEYSFEGGQEVDGTDRDNADLLGLEAAFQI